MENGQYTRLRFPQIVDLPECEQNKLVSIRNQDSVRSKMFTSHIIQLSEHRGWIDSLRLARRNFVWAIYLDELLIGAVAMSNVSEQHKTADWAFYVTSSQQGTGVGGIIEYLFLEHAFLVKSIEKVNCEVIASNIGVVRMHKKFGFQIEGTRRQNISTASGREDVHLLGLLRHEWLEFRDRIRTLTDRIYSGLSMAASSD
jgi:UDP-4-amino-4,6-dideoxy-N-acetyl-beta-L-altrosamine N-acetyltransferase